MPQCKYCTKQKRYEEFRFRTNHGKYVRTSQCLDCYNEYQRKYYRQRSEIDPDWLKYKSDMALRWQRANPDYKRREGLQRASERLGLV